MNTESTIKVSEVTEVQLQNWIGDAKLYQLSEPISYGSEEDMLFTSYLLLSAIEINPVLRVIFRESGTSCETYIFPADLEGNVLSWCELEGSQKNTLSHKKVLIEAGFEMVD